jgi:N-acetylmuramoyl-L-alanine amidase
MSFLRPVIVASLCASTAAGAAPPRVAVDAGHTLAEPGASQCARAQRVRVQPGTGRPIGCRHCAVAARKVQEVNFGRHDRQPGRARPEQARGSDFFISPSTMTRSVRRLPGVLGLGRRGSEPHDVKRGFGIFVSRRNPDLATSLRCASVSAP